ncbi:MAG: endonuclease III [Nitrososphaerota archaeon]|nr:endonuclease III [Nitrososphaerota archaeon]
MSGSVALKALEKTIRLDKKDFPVLSSRSPFEILVATILSQNTSDKNTEKSLRNLRERIGITPEEILKTDLKVLKSTIRSSGLYNIKATVIKKLAKIVIEKYGGRLERIFDKSIEEARNELMSLPGVGPKTADVILLFAGGKPTFPIDTHVFRVSRRLGIIGEKDSYEEARRKLMRFFQPKHYLKAHLLLIGHGRRICKARSPLCRNCVLLKYCSFGKSLLKTL